MSAALELITTRPWNPDTDKPFVMATWLKGLLYGDSWFSIIPKDVFMPTYHAFLTQLLDSPGVEVTIACLVEDPDVIVGYSVATNTVLHWVFCKKAWRKIGVARLLLPKTVSTVSHLTDLGRKLLPKLPDVVFNPFIA